jgi:phospholipase C
MDAEHIVILMQENRSFDHALGTLQGARGFNDPRAIRFTNGNSVFVQTDPRETRMLRGDSISGTRALPGWALRNTISSGASKGMTVATYAVKPGDTLSEEFPLSLFADARYSIEVHGPNGFYRAFTGNPHAPTVHAETAYERENSQLTDNVQIRLSNSSERPITVTVQDNAYKTAAVTRTIAAGREASVVLNLKQSYGWYDFTVKTDGSQSEARFAGRVETGRSSFSDPLMGGVVQS